MKYPYFFDDLNDNNNENDDHSKVRIKDKIEGIYINIDKKFIKTCYSNNLQFKINNFFSFKFWKVISIEE